MERKAEVAIGPVAAYLLAKPLNARQYAHARLTLLQRNRLTHVLRNNLLNPLLLELLSRDGDALQNRLPTCEPQDRRVPGRQLPRRTSRRLLGMGWFDREIDGSRREIHREGHYARNKKQQQAEAIKRGDLPVNLVAVGLALAF